MSPAKAKAQPGTLQWVALAGAAVLLTGTFAYLRFPYDRLAESLTARLADAGVRVEIGELSPHLSLAGPGIAASDLKLTRPDGNVMHIDRLRMRPAWSLAWLMARPALRLQLETPQGEVDGVAVLRGPQRFTGELRDVNLTEVLGADALSGTQLEGRVSFDVDVAFDDTGPSGPIRIHAKDGVLQHPQLPMAIPYQELNGDLSLGGESWLQIASLEVRSPLGTGTLRGTVGRAPDPRQAPLDLELEVQVAQGVRGSLVSQGVRVGRDGALHYKISGTASAPVVR